MLHYGVIIIFFSPSGCVVLRWQSAPEDHRRKWDKEEYERIAQERSDAEKLEEILNEGRSAHNKEPPVKRELLKPRDYKVDLQSKLGKSQVITKTTPASGQGG